MRVELNFHRFYSKLCNSKNTINCKISRPICHWHWWWKISAVYTVHGIPKGNC